ncbi:MAG: aldo/keto reductase [Fibrobacter sp.]|nr:aldo/keto reductase [Fibrobacter sp.]
MKLGLGTVQFGLDYGISNTSGKTSLEEVRKILSLAKKSGIRLLDTAAAYGESESILGNTIESASDFRIVTKVKGNHDVQSNDTSISIVQQSLDKLRVTSLYGCLFHSVDDLLNKDGESYYKKVHKLKEDGIIQKIGVSIYNSKEIDSLLSNFDFDIVQIPINIFDQRLIQSGHLSLLKKRNIEIHARSIFLQGLMFLDASKLDTFFNTAKPSIIRLNEHAALNNLTISQIALGFVKNLSEIDTMLMGVNTVEQLTRNINDYNYSIDNCFDYSAFAISEESILNPSKWPKRR